MKATAQASTDIAFIKYWGRKDEILRLPSNGSISMVLDGTLTTTTVEFSPSFSSDQVTIDGAEDEDEASRVVKHLDRIRKLAGVSYKAKMISQNNFPSGTGLSSSSSGFAALTLAASSALGLELSLKELSILARQGSGSSCRTVINGGIVEWMDGDDSDSSYAVQIFGPNHWDLVDVIAVVSDEKKHVGTSEGQTYAHSSPFFSARMGYIQNRILDCKDALARRDFSKLGEIIEHEALDLHCIMLSSTPALIYWTVGTLKIMKLVQKWRAEGLEVYFSLNTGQDIHLICEGKNKDKVIAKLNEVEEVKRLIINGIGDGTKLVDKHLF